MKKRRPYRLKQRAEQQQQTREQIVAATMALHEELGPKATTVSAIAERAGVERLTVYRHFPDQQALFAACTARWMEMNEAPDPSAWGAIAEPAARSRAALGALYAYYRKTERMWTVSYRDLSEVPALASGMAAFKRYLRSIADDLAKAWSTRAPANRALRATVGHAVQFATWQSLAAEGLKPAEMAELVVRWIAAVADSR